MMLISLWFFKNDNNYPSSLSLYIRVSPVFLLTFFQFLSRLTVVYFMGKSRLVLYTSLMPNTGKYGVKSSLLNGLRPSWTSRFISSLNTLSYRRIYLLEKLLLPSFYRKKKKRIVVLCVCCYYNKNSSIIVIFFICHSIRHIFFLSQIPLSYRCVRF